MKFRRVIVVTYLVATGFVGACAPQPIGEQGAVAYQRPAPEASAVPSSYVSAKPPSPVRQQRKEGIVAPFSRENYAYIAESGFRSPLTSPLSTLSVDVDTASYSNVRRMIQEGFLPPADAVRIEELINYFAYDYPQPDRYPVGISTETSPCPWNSDNLLLQIGLKARDVDLATAPANNLVFLIDVSGSMGSPDKLPLLISAFKMLVTELRPQDRVSIVVYAGTSGVVLPATSGSDKRRINAALEKLKAAGSTAGGAGVELAYALALENFLPEGNNRVLLATDGDFNVGVSGPGALVRLIEEKRKMGVFLTVLGFGRGNLQDAAMESLADHGNGNYAYIDSVLEARKVLVEQLGGTLLTVAKDVKMQVEFNPALVAAYRLIGYENRQMRAEDFADDRKDAGEMGAGHAMTALYELVPQPEEGSGTTETLRFQAATLSADAVQKKVLAQVTFRYKEPAAGPSHLVTRDVAYGESPEKMSENIGFASAVAEWGLLLRESPDKGDASYAAVFKRAMEYRGADLQGLRGEFARLVDATRLLDSTGK